MKKTNNTLLWLFLLINMTSFSQDTLLLQQIPSTNRYYAKNISLDSLFIFDNGEIKNVPLKIDSTTMHRDIKTGKIVDPYFYKTNTFIATFDAQKTDTLWMWGKYKKNSYFLIYIPVPKYLKETNRTDKMEVKFIKYRNSLGTFFSRKKSFGVTYGSYRGTFYMTKETKLGEGRGNIYPLNGKNKSRRGRVYSIKTK